MIEITGLTKQFGAIPAVSGIDLTVGQGEVLGFLGPNGAGKSTTMKMVTGYLTPDAGTVRVCGHDMATDTLAAQRMIGYLPEGAPAYGDMTPRHFLGFIAEIRGLRGAGAKKAVADAVTATELDAVLDQPIETLSKGFKRRVGLAQAILHNPAVLIMDEPTDGLDPNQKHAVRELIRAMAATKAIVVSTHVLEEVEAICTRAVIIDRGRVGRRRYARGVARALAAPQCGDTYLARRSGGAREGKAEDAAQCLGHRGDGTWRRPRRRDRVPEKRKRAGGGDQPAHRERELGHQAPQRGIRAAGRCVPRHHHA